MISRVAATVKRRGKHSILQPSFVTKSQVVKRIAAFTAALCFGVAVHFS